MFQKIRQLIRRPTAPTTAPPAEAVVADQPLPLDVTDATFGEIVLGSDQLAVVDCWADWCQPCQVMSAYVMFLARDYADRILVGALDVDANPETAAQYEIMGLPTLLFMRNGVEIDRQIGLLAYDELRKRVDQWLAE